MAVSPLLAVLLAAGNLTSSSSPSPSFQQIAKEAEVARTTDRANDAIRLYSEGLRLQPSWSEGWWFLGSLYYDQDRFRDSEAALNRFVAIAAKPGPAYAFLALCEYEMKEYDRALRHFQEWGIKGSPGTSDLIDVAGFHWALLLTRQGQFVQALYLLAAKAEKRGSSPTLTEAMGLASLRIPNLPGEYPQDRREAVWLAGEAAFYSAVHEYDRSRDYADRLLKRYDGIRDVHYFRGTLYTFWKEDARAADEYRRELEISPQHCPAMVELALIYLDDGRASEALPLARNAVSLESNNARAHYALGWSLLEGQNVPESVRELEVAKRYAPESAPIRFALMKAYRALGRDKDAARELDAFNALKKKENAQAAAPN